MFYFLLFYTPSMLIIRYLNVSINQETTLTLFSPMQIVCELPTSTNWNFDVHWYPRIPYVISAFSFDGKIGLYNIEVQPFWSFLVLAKIFTLCRFPYNSVHRINILDYDFWECSMIFFPLLFDKKLFSMEERNIQRWLIYIKYFMKNEVDISIGNILMDKRVRLIVIV